MNESPDIYNKAATDSTELGNDLADAFPEADLWDIADGLLAGAIQYWLYTRQPCGDPTCEDCADVNTAEQRMASLNQLVGDLAQDSEYYHTPTDANVGRA